MQSNIFWFRRDLRIEDNTALIQALNSSQSIIPIFIFDINIIKKLPKDDARISFIYNQLIGIKESLILSKFLDRELIFPYISQHYTL